MLNQQTSTTDDQKHGAEDADQQALSLDDQKYCAEEEGQASTLDDQKCSAEDDGLAGVNVGRSVARRRRWGISTRRHPTFRNMASKMEDQRAPKTDGQKHGAEDWDQQVLSFDDQNRGADGV